jgi:hypothetical protein
MKRQDRVVISTIRVFERCGAEFQKAAILSFKVNPTQKQGIPDWASTVRLSGEGERRVSHNKINI